MAAKKATSKKSSTTKKASSKSAPKASSSKVAEDGKVCAVLQYLFPIGLIWWLLDTKMRTNAFATFHMKEVLALLILSVIINVVGSVIPFIGWFIILPLGNLLVLIVWIMGIYRAVVGQTKHLPVSGAIAKKF